MNEVHLVGKHYPESKHPLRKYCMLCGYKYKDGKHPRKKKHGTIVRNVINWYAKIALNCIILKLIQGNDNIRV